jgi:hypothetical protein
MRRSGTDPGRVAYCRCCISRPMLGRMSTADAPLRPPRQPLVTVPVEPWKRCLPGRDPASIAWATYRAHRQRVQAHRNRLAHDAPGGPRQGKGLLQGLGVCGRCGRHRGGAVIAARNAVICGLVAIGTDRSMADPVARRSVGQRWMRRWPRRGSRGTDPNGGDWHSTPWSRWNRNPTP